MTDCRSISCNSSELNNVVIMGVNETCFISDATQKMLMHESQCQIILKQTCRFGEVVSQKMTHELSLGCLIKQLEFE